VAESNLQVVLKLTALFGAAAADASRDLTAIADKIDDLGAKKSVFAGLQEAANNLNTSLEGVQNRLKGLDLGLGSVGTKAEDSARSVRSAKSSIDDMGKAAGAAEVTVKGAAKAVDDLGQSAGKVNAVAAAVSDVAKVSDIAKASFMGLLGAIDQTDKGSLSKIMGATRQLEANVRSATEAVRALNREMLEGAKVSLGMTAPPSQTALNPAKPLYPQMLSYSGPVSSDVSYRSNNPIEGSFSGQRALGAAERLALTGGTSVRSGVNAPTGGYAPNAIVPVGSSFYEGEYQDFAQDAKFRDTGKGPREYKRGGRGYIPGEFTGGDNGGGFSGPTLSDLDAMDAAAAKAAMQARVEGHKAQQKKWESVYKQGDHMQSTGYAGLVNGAMLLGVGAPMFGNAMKTEQLDAQNEITIRANGGNAQSAQFLRDSVHQIAQKNGGDYSDVVGSGAAFVSSMTPSANVNNAEWQKSMAYALDRANKVSIVSTAGGAPITSTQTAVATNQAIANLGIDVSDPKKFGEAVKEVTNMLVKMKNVTPSTVPDTLAFLRAVGPVAALNGVKPEDMTGLVYALGKEKMVGSSAGNAVKRLFQRETLPAKKTLEVQDAVRKETGFELSMYDKKGKARSLVDVLDQVAQADKKAPFSDKTRSQVVGQLSGLYANAPIGALLQFMEKNGGKDGLRKQGSSIMHGGIEGSGKQDAADAEFEKQQKSLAVAVQQTTNKIKEAWQGVFQDLEPTFTKIVKGIGWMADTFSKLPAPVKDGAVELALLVGVVSIGAGIFGVLGGNMVKLFGGLMGIKTGSLLAADGTKTVITLGERMSGMFGGAVTAVAGFIKEFVGVRIIGPIFEGLTFAVEAFGAMLGLELLPAIAVIGLVAASAALLYAAWSTNFYGVRDVVANAMHAVSGWLGNASKALQGWWEYAGKATEGVRKYFLDLWKDVVGVIKGIDDALGGWGQKAIGAIGSLANGAGKIAKQMGDSIGKHIGEGAQIAGKEVSALQKQFGHMADAAKKSATAWITPSAGNTGRVKGADGKAAPAIDFGNFSNEGSNIAAPSASGIDNPALRKDLDGIFDPSGKGKKKKKKDKKEHDDISVSINDLSSEEVDKLARQLEKQWKAKGVKLTPEFVDLKDGSGNVIERVYGYAKAFQQAVKDLAPDKGLKQQVVNYIEQAKFFRTGTEQEVTRLEEFLKKAKTQGLKAYIEEQIANVDQKQLAQIAKVTAHSKEVHNALYGSDGSKETPTGGLVGKFTDTGDSSTQTIADADKSFKELQQSQKNAIPTVEQLKERYNLLYTEQKSVSDDQDKMAKVITEVTQKLAVQDAQYKTLTGNTRAVRQERASLLSEMNAERGTLGELNSGLALQKTQLDQVTASMNRANAEYQKAVEYQKTLAFAFQQAGIAAKTAVQTEGGNILGGAATGFFNRISGNGYRSNDISKLVGTYVSTYINSAAGPLAKALLPGGKDDNTSKPVFDTKTFGAVDQSAKSLASIDSKMTKQTDALKAGSDNTNVFKGMKQSGDGALPVKGKTDYAASPGTIPGGGADLANSSFGDYGSASSKKKNSLDDLLNSKTAKLLSGGLGAILSTTAGMSQGGVGGGITAGVGTFTSLTGAGVPSPVAIPIAAASALIAAFTHHDSPENQPDKFDTQNFGTIVSNLVGSGYNKKAQFGANGTSFVEDNNTAIATNNLGDIQYIQQWAQNNLKNTDASIAAQAKQLNIQFGNYNPNATPQQVLAIGDNGSGKNAQNQAVVGGTLSGTYTSIYNTAIQAVNSIQQLSSASLQAAQNAKALADSFTANLIGGPSGFNIPYLGSNFGGNASSSFLPGGSIQRNTTLNNGGQFGSQTPGSATLTSNVTLRFLEGATVSNSTEVVDAINQMIPQITNAVNQANYNTMRYTQGYQSQLS
jgi:TP901 family phage tail tape measure protein